MLDRYRKHLDKLDKKLVHLLEKRFETAEKIGDYKIKHNMDIFVPEREEKVLETRVNITKNADYRIYIKEIFELLMKHSKQVQGLKKEK